MGGRRPRRAGGIPYIGSNSRTMKDMIDKFQTHETLARRGVAVPVAPSSCAAPGRRCRPSRYPAFVKPMGESRSVGINDDSVVHDADELRRQVAWIETRVPRRPALVEDFMPGDEFTALVLGNGADARVPARPRVTVEPKHYGRHKVLRGATCAASA
ncbi:MAG: hypothetical protein M0C28_06375 [Candidatus Moduliflexus flocculans]|nr:hypothetical protein [Candidatus Moduliflexus flocculans]